MAAPIDSSSLPIQEVVSTGSPVSVSSTTAKVKKYSCSAILPNGKKCKRRAVDLFSLQV